MTRPLYDYDRWPNFSIWELVCHHTGLENPNVEAFTELMDAIQELRDIMGIPFTVTSCYRDPSHPYEVTKDSPGQHTIAAIDIRVPSEHCHEFTRIAFELGFTGIGWNMTGDHGSRFIHLDFRDHPRIWSY